jgi:hypothetical protein
LQQNKLGDLETSKVGSTSMSKKTTAPTTERLQVPEASKSNTEKVISLQD